MSIMPLSMKITTFLRFLVFLHGVQKVRSSVHVFGDIENFRPPYTNALSAVDDFWSPRHFYFCKFSMLNNYFPRRFHFFDFFHVHNAYFNENNHIFTIFDLFTWYELAPGMRKNTFGKTPRSAKTLDVHEKTPRSAKTLDVHGKMRASCTQIGPHVRTRSHSFTLVHVSHVWSELIPNPYYCGSFLYFFILAILVNLEKNQLDFCITDQYIMQIGIL